MGGKLRGGNMSITKETCGVCNKIGTYNHDNDEDGSMTLLTHYFDYIHWKCFDKAMIIRDRYDKAEKKRGNMDRRKLKLALKHKTSCTIQHTCYPCGTRVFFYERNFDK